MIVAIDVDYRGNEAVTACVGFRAWTERAVRACTNVRDNHPRSSRDPHPPTFLI